MTKIHSQRPRVSSPMIQPQSQVQPQTSKAGEAQGGAPTQAAPKPVVGDSYVDIPDVIPVPPHVGRPSRLPDPPNKLERLRHQVRQELARKKFDKTLKDALADGKITDKEQREINAAGREKKIADQQVKVDKAADRYAELYKQAMADGKIDVLEAFSLQRQDEVLTKAEKKLKEMVTEDAMEHLFDRQDGKPPWDFNDPHGRPAGPDDMVLK